VITETDSNGYWLIEGSLKPSSSGFIAVQFAQAVSDPSSTIADQGSFLEVSEQK
jgi:hypothetical protein